MHKQISGQKWIKPSIKVGLGWENSAICNVEENLQ